MNARKEAIAEELNCEFVFPCSFSAEEQIFRCFHETKSSVMKESMLFLVPKQHFFTPNPTNLTKQTTPKHMRRLEDHLDALLYSSQQPNIQLNSEITPPKPESVVEFLELLYDGVKIQANNKENQDEIRPKHPNLLRLNSLMEGESSFYVIFHYEKQTLQDFIIQTVLPPDCQQENSTPLDIRKRFLIYQLLHGVSFIHRQNLAFAIDQPLNPAGMFLTRQLWLRVGGFPLCPNLHPCQSFDQISTIPLTQRWCYREISNLDYILAINKAAGRKLVDGTFHPIVPWVTDFSVRDGGWRDLTKSKFRLKKGDSQLDQTYLNSEVPHHITESLSEITYYIYMARRTPMQHLQQNVRSNFQAKEYPSSISRLYEWTPDECIPEFYTDPSVFKSLHGEKYEMADLAWPSWCGSAEEFIEYHRAQLESDHVSSKLHHWIDLNFGCALSGTSAQKHKNVPLPNSKGFVQVFQTNHPRRQVSPPSIDNQVDENAIIRQQKIDLKMYEKAVKQAIGMANAQNELIADYVLEQCLNDKRRNIQMTGSFDDSILNSTVNNSSDINAIANSSTYNSSGLSPKSPSSASKIISTALPKFFDAHPSNSFSGSSSSVNFPNNSNTNPSSSGNVIANSTVNNSSTILPRASLVRGVSNPIPVARTPPHSLKEWWHNFVVKSDEESDSHQFRNPFFQKEYNSKKSLQAFDVKLLQLNLPSHMEGSDISNKQKQVEMDYLEQLKAFTKRYEHFLNPVYCMPLDFDLDNQEIDETKHLQAIDAFAVGCIVAEIYLGRPLFCGQTIEEYVMDYKVHNDNALMNKNKCLYSKPSPFKVMEALPILHNLPPVVKNIVSDLVHPNYQQRPTIETVIHERFQSTSSNSFNLPNLCIFPRYFDPLHDYLGRFFHIEDWYLRFQLTFSRLPALCQLPNEVFEIICGPVLLSFLECLQTRSQSASRKQTQRKQMRQASLALNYFFKPLASKLQNSSQQILHKQVTPRVIELYEQMDQIEDVSKLLLLSVPLLKSIVKYIGSRIFLENILPILIDWLSCDSKVIHEGASGPISMAIKSACAFAIGELSATDALGPGLATRYILPVLIPLVGRMKSKWKKLVDLSFKNPDDSVNVNVVYCEVSRHRRLAVADAIVSVCGYVTESPICTTVLPYFIKALQKLIPLADEISRSTNKNISLPDELGFEIYGILRLLRNILGHLNEVAIVREFISSSLLASFVKNLNPAFLPNSSTGTETPKSPLCVGISRTLVAVCKRVPKEHLVTQLCPSIDIFFSKCVEIYGGCVHQHIADLEKNGALLPPYNVKLAIEVVKEMYIPVKEILGGVNVTLKNIPSTASLFFSQVQQIIKEEQDKDAPSTFLTTPNLMERLFAPLHLQNGNNKICEPMLQQIENEAKLILQTCSYLKKSRNSPISHLHRNSTGVFSRSSSINQQHSSFRKNRSPSGSTDDVWLNSINNSNISNNLKLETLEILRAHSTGVTVLNIDSNENLILSGSQNGSCRVWRLSDYPVSVQCSYYSSSSTNSNSLNNISSLANGYRGNSNQSIFAVFASQDGKSGFSCNRNMVQVWDLNYGRSLAHYSSASNGFWTCLASVTDTALGGALRPGNVANQTQLLAGTSYSSIASLDIRHGLDVVAEWVVPPPSGNINCSKSYYFGISTVATTALPFIVAAYESGQVAILDQRTGGLLLHWQAHSNSIIKVFYYKVNELITVSLDRTAILWKLFPDGVRKPFPALIIKNLPEGMTSSTVSFHETLGAGILYASGGLKFAEVHIPDRLNINSKGYAASDLTEELKANVKQVSEQMMAKNQKGSLPIQSIGVLPLRKLLLLGTEDGYLRVCT